MERRELFKRLATAAVGAGLAAEGKGKTVAARDSKLGRIGITSFCSWDRGIRNAVLLEDGTVVDEHGRGLNREIA